MVSKMSPSAQKVTEVPDSSVASFFCSGAVGGTELVVLGPAEAVALDLDSDARRQGVDDRNADAVQTAGDGVAAAAELAARVQHGEHDLDGWLPLGGDDVHGDAAAVVDDAHAAVGQDRHVDGVRVSGQGLVDGVVDDLLHQVVQATLTGRADVHAGPLADRVQSLQDGDRAGVVRRRRLSGRGAGCGALVLGGGGVLVGVAGIGHEAPFLAQHRPSPAYGGRPRPGQAGAAASFSVGRRVPQAGGITTSVPVALT
ncbi:hypothetical protein GCM10020000_40500 [Streptomyces olivoverticillatus]